MSGAAVASKRKKETVDIQTSTVLNENELVAYAEKHCSHPAPPCGAERCPEVAHCVVMKFASVLEREKPPFVFADAKSLVCFSDDHGQTDSFGRLRHTRPHVKDGDIARPRGQIHQALFHQAQREVGLCRHQHGSGANNVGSSGGGPRHVFSAQQRRGAAAAAKRIELDAGSGVGEPRALVVWSHGTEGHDHP